MDHRTKNLISFDILESSELKITANFLVSKALPSLEGHFPENPILPAVSIIDISLFLLETAGQKVDYANIDVKRSKFTSIVRPQQKIELSAESTDGSNWQVVWRLLEDSAKVAQVGLVI